jgi:predicted transcriptional regulator
MSKEKFIAIRIDEDLKRKLQIMADKDSRSLSDYIRLQLKKLVEKVK